MRIDIMVLNRNNIKNYLTFRKYALPSLDELSLIEVQYIFYLISMSSSLSVDSATFLCLAVPKLNYRQKKGIN